MKIELTQTEEDLVAFYQFDRWYSDERKNYRIKTRFISGTITTIPIWPIFINAKIENISSIVGLILFGLFLFLIGFISIKNIIVNNLRGLSNKIAKNKNNSELFGQNTIEFTADKIAWASQWGHGQNEKETIKKIKSDERYYYLYNTSFSAYVIPKSIFKSDDELKEFECILNNYQ